MKRTMTWLGMIFVLVLCMTPARAAETSQTIAFSACDGTLTGTVDLRLRLFTASAAGMMVLEETQTGIDASSTCFSVRVGDATAGGLPPALFAGNPSLWITFALDATPDTELGGGRTPITANGYAFRANQAGTAQSAATAQTAASADTATLAQSLNPGATVAGDSATPILTINNNNLLGTGLSVTGGQGMGSIGVQGAGNTGV